MSDFADFLHEVFQHFGPVTISRMFGGQGVWRDGLMFALVHEETLYLKTDAESAGEFVSRRLPPFQFVRNDRVMVTSYYQAPAEILEDRAEAAAWARRAFEAALRARSAKDGKGRTMATAKQKSAARSNIKKAATAAKKKRTIAHLPKKTRTALGKQGASVAKKKKAAKKRRR